MQDNSTRRGQVGAKVFLPKNSLDVLLDLLISAPNDHETHFENVYSGRRRWLMLLAPGYFPKQSRCRCLLESQGK